MEVVQKLFFGLSIALQPGNLWFCFLGVFMGTLIGVLPGIGPTGAIAILLPVTFRMSPVAAVIMLAGIYYGSQYGGSTTSILVNIPGEASSIVTCLDGYAMAKRGRAGAALGLAAFGSFIAGTLGVLGLMVFAEPLAVFGLKFGPPEFFSVILLGLTLITYLSHGSKVKAFMMGAVGLVLSCVGLDPITGSARLTFDVMRLWDGIDLVALAMGLFGISEILVNLEETASTEILKEKIGSLFPTIADWVRAKGAILRGTIIGFFLGILPGGGAVVSSFLSYGLEKRLSKRPEEFGKGAVEGVAGPESANNAATAGAFIPLFTLGIPSNVVMALLLGALLIHGVRPGPLLLHDHPDVFWGVVFSMYIGNVMLLVLNLPLIPIWVQLLKVPYQWLFPFICIFCVIGTFSLKNDTFDVNLMLMAGAMGYLLRKFDYEPAPLLLAFILGPIFETNLRQSLLLSKGSFSIFFRGPISSAAMAIAILLCAAPLFPYLYRSVSERLKLG